MCGCVDWGPVGGGVWCSKGGEGVQLFKVVRCGGRLSCLAIFCFHAPTRPLEFGLRYATH